MNTIEERVSVGRQRRRYSEEFEAQTVANCQGPGVSIAAIALHHQLNASLLRRWVEQAEGSCNDPRQEIIGNGRHARDGHMTQAARGDVAYTEQRDIEIVEQLFSARGENASYGRGRNASGCSLEQPHAERLFELLDAAAQCRPRNVERLRCVTEATQLHDGSKRLQIVEVEVDADEPSSAF